MHLEEKSMTRKVANIGGGFENTNGIKGKNINIKRSNEQQLQVNAKGFGRQLKPINDLQH